MFKFALSDIDHWQALWSARRLSVSICFAANFFLALAPIMTEHAQPSLAVQKWIRLIHQIIAEFDDCVQNQSWVQLRLDTRVVTIQVPNSYIAKGLWNERSDLEKLGFGVRIFVGEKKLISSPHIANIANDITMLTINGNKVVGDSPYLQAHKNWVPIWASYGTHWIYRKNREQGYPCEAVIPFSNCFETIGVSEKDEELIKKGELTRELAVANLVSIGTKQIKTAYDRKPIIKEAVIRAIEGAIQKGHSEVDYSYFWGPAPGYERSWDMVATAVLDNDHVIVITQNRDSSDRDYWRNLSKVR